MRNENDFNAYLTKEIRKLGTDYKAIKLADKFRIGMPDWLMFYKGLAVGVEAKFIRGKPKKDTSKLLAHPVTAPQISYMKSLELAGVKCKVLIGSALDAKIRVISFPDLPETGNYSLGEFEALHESCLCKFTDVDSLVEKLFGGHGERD